MVRVQLLQETTLLLEVGHQFVARDWDANIPAKAITAYGNDFRFMIGFGILPPLFKIRFRHFDCDKLTTFSGTKKVDYGFSHTKRNIQILSAMMRFLRGVRPQDEASTSCDPNPKKSRNSVNLVNRQCSVSLLGSAYNHFLGYPC